jgi:hypothetical protein
MSRITALAFILAMPGWLGRCSAPERPASTVYREDKRISSPAGVPHDSTTNYFPASTTPNTSQNAPAKRLGGCYFESCLLSETLFNFNAPVLSNYYLGHASYRFLWLRAFRLPVLLTLDVNESGGVLKTQSVNRYPSHTSSVNEVAAASEPIIKRINQAKRLIRAGQEVPANAEWLASSIARLDDIRLAGTPVIITEKALVLTRDQVRQFLGLLDQANIWQLPACTSSYYLDGVSYVFEAHEAGRYKVIHRSNPPVNGSFARCCQFLTDLSSAKAEAGY